MKRTCRVYRMGMTHTCQPVAGIDRFVACISFGSLKPPQGGRYENAQPVWLGASLLHMMTSRRLDRCEYLVRAGRRRRGCRRRLAVVRGGRTNGHARSDHGGGHNRRGRQRTGCTSCACTTSCATCCSCTGVTLSERKRGRQDSSDEENFFHNCRTVPADFMPRHQSNIVRRVRTISR